MILEVENLQVSFSLYGKELKAVRGVSFVVKKGEAVAIVGESGCGKSAAVQAILRLASGAKIAGKVRFLGRDLTELNEKGLQKVRGLHIGMIFQDPFSSLNPTMTIGRQIMEGLLFHKLADKIAAKKRALDLLQEVEIDSPNERFFQYPHQLSGGMRQRVLIAIALAANPSLLIADEPTTALDANLQAQILEVLKRQKEKTSLLLVTHDLAAAAQIASRILVFYAGKIVEEGCTHKILRHPEHPYTQMLLRSLPHFGKLRSEFLEPISGSPPNLIHPLSGCAFAERCPYALEICKKEEPPFINGRACWRKEYPSND